jgi:uncharacterized membrane protein YkvA (DUF1232 family)
MSKAYISISRPIHFRLEIQAGTGLAVIIHGSYNVGEPLALSGVIVYLAVPGPLLYCRLTERVTNIMRFISRIIDWVATPYTIYLLLKDPMISRSEKLRAVIGLVVIFAYIISPIDIVPDFIPLAGWVDDLVVVPLGLALVRIITPGINIVETRNRAQKDVKQILFWAVISLVVAVLLGLLWLGLLVYIIVRLITG